MELIYGYFPPLLEIVILLELLGNACCNLNYYHVKLTYLGTNVSNGDGTPAIHCQPHRLGVISFQP